MDRKTVAIVSGIAEGFNKASQNLFTIMQNRAKWEKKNELTDLEIKQAEMEIEKMKLSGDFDPDVIKAKRDKIKAEAKKIKAQADSEQLKFDEAERQSRLSVKEKAQEATTYMKAYQDALNLPGTASAVEGEGADMGLPEGWSVDYTVGEEPKLKYKTPKEKEWKPSSVDKVLGTLQSGMTEDPMYGLDLATSREEMEDYALREFGPDWREKVPEAVEIINRRWGEVETERGSAEAPETDLREQAIKELKNANYPTSDANIRAVIEQLRKK